MELENFDRGHKPDKKKQWWFTKQSWSALRYLPTISQSMQHDDAWIYQRRISEPRWQPVGAGIVSKWSMSTRAEIYDGELRRGAASFGSPAPFLSFPFLSFPVLWEVFSSGTVDTISEVEDRDEEARALRSRGSGPGHPLPLRSAPLLSLSPLLGLLNPDYEIKSQQAKRTVAIVLQGKEEKFLPTTYSHTYIQSGI